MRCIAIEKDAQHSAGGMLAGGKGGFLAAGKALHVAAVLPYDQNTGEHGQNTTGPADIAKQQLEADGQQGKQDRHRD